MDKRILRHFGETKDSEGVIVQEVLFRCDRCGEITRGTVGILHITQDNVNDGPLLCEVCLRYAFDFTTLYY